MKIRSSLLTILIIVLPVPDSYRDCQAQNLYTRILMSVGSSQTEAGEFIRMYKKSKEGKPLPLDDYLSQYIIFKLKVADAISEGYDTAKSFRNELNGYRTQLAQNYLTDTQTRENLLRKAYQRSLTEINAWHILVAMPQNVSPADTLKAWKKANDIRERILQGEPFEQVARSSSDDQSVKMNGGNLGYFTAFQMIMPFEDAAYSLKKGALSKPVRTPYGYHIIKIADIRPSKGKIQVAHIMKNAPPGISEEEAQRAEDEINSIYKKLTEGASFNELAKKYSDHKESAAKGGVLNWFGTGEMIPEFSEAAFALTDTGNYSKPFRTIYGWHIVKLLNRKPPLSFEESSSFLESRINKSYLNSLSKKTFVEKLKKEYKFKISTIACDWFINNSDTLVIQGLKKYDRSSIPEGIIYSFTGQSLQNKEFADYIENRGPMVITRDSSVFIKTLLEESATEKMISYENSVLEKKYPDFRYLMNEFHDGILLFDISGKKVWDRASNDSVGLHKYYEENKNNYLSEKQIKAKIYTLKVINGEKTLSSAYAKYAGKPDEDKRLLKKFNTGKDTLLIIKDGLWQRGDNPEADIIEWTPGTSHITFNGFPSIILVERVIDPLPLRFDQVQDKMMAGYEEFLESEWIRQLKNKYNVKIDTFVLDEVKQKLINE
jgi:peptidyl-prolyl cis-trans isomerase SurA